MNLKPCPFCGVEMIANMNQADHYVRRYGTHWEHPSSACALSNHEVTPSNVKAWNVRAATSRGALADERAAFEAWAAPHGLIMTYSDMAWVAWKARAALAAQVAPAADAASRSSEAPKEQA